MKRRGPIPQCGPYLIGEEARSVEAERDLRLTVASLRAQLGGIKAYAEDLELENRQLRLDNAELRRRVIFDMDKPE